MNNLTPLITAKDPYMEMYGEKFHAVSKAINKLCEHAPFREQFPDMSPMSEEQWMQFLKDWIRLTGKLEREDDRAFLLPTMMPVSYGAYECFVELNAADCSVFMIGYAHLKTSGWFKYELFEDLIGLSASNFDEIDFAHLKQQATWRFSEKYSSYM